MPAARQRPQQTLSTSLAAHVRRQAPVNILPLNYYYRSGHFLLRQVSLDCMLDMFTLSSSTVVSDLFFCRLMSTDLLETRNSCL